MDLLRIVEDRTRSLVNPLPNPEPGQARPSPEPDRLNEALGAVAFSAESLLAGQAKAGLVQVLGAGGSGLATLSAGHALDPERVASILSDPLLQDL